MATVSGRPSSDDQRALETMLGVQTQRDEGQSIAQLLSGIVEDAQLLVRREVDLAKQEVINELDKVKQGATSLGIGIGLAAVGGIMLTLMLVYLLHEVAGLPLWGSYFIVGAILGGIGAFMLMSGIKRMKQIDPIPHETIDTVKEDIAWIREQNPSDKT